MESITGGWIADERKCQRSVLYGYRRQSVTRWCDCRSTWVFCASRLLQVGELANSSAAKAQTSNISSLLFSLERVDGLLLSLRSVYILYTHTQQQATRCQVAEQVDADTMDLAMASPEALKTPQPPGVPRLPDDGFWTGIQWAIFMSLMDSIVPAIVPKAALADREGQLGIPDVEYSAVMKTVQDTAVERRDEGSLKAFMEDRPSTNPAVHESLVRIIARLPPTQQDRLGRFLSNLSYVPTHPLAGKTW